MNKLCYLLSVIQLFVICLFLGDPITGEFDMQDVSTSQN